MKEKTHSISRLHAIPWILLFVLINLFLLINGIGKTLARKALDDLIEQELPPFYNLSYELLEFSLLDKELTIINLLFTPDSTIQASGVERAFEVHIPHFDIRLKSLDAILFDQQLLVEGVTIVDPQFAIRDFSRDKVLTASTESLSLFELIRQYLSLFRVSALEVKNAGLQYKKEGHGKKGALSLREIFFRVQEFAVDSTLTRRNFLNAESVELIINKQLFYLSDDLHRFSFDRFRLSTRDSVLSFSNVVLEPRVDIPDTMDTRYQLYIPEVNLKGVDYHQSYLNKDLRIDHVLLFRPEIVVKGGREKAISGRDAKQNALLDVLSQLAPSIQVERIQLEDAKVALDFQQSLGRDFSFEVDHLNLFRCFIDPEDMAYTKGRAPFQEFNFKLTNYRERLPDEMHVLEVEQVDIPSLAAGIYLRDFSIFPYDEHPHSTQTKVYQQFPYMSIEGIDYLGFLFGDPLDIKRLYIKAPYTRLLTPLKEQERPSAVPDIDSIRASITGSFMKRITAAALRVERGRWQVDDWLTVGDYDLSARGFRVDKKIRSWKGLADTLSLNAGNVELRLEGQQLSIADFSTNSIAHDFKGIRYRSTSPEDSVDISLGRLQIGDSDLDSLLHQRFRFDTLKMDRLRAFVKLKAVEKKTGQDPFTLKFPLYSPNLLLTNAALNLELPNGDELTFSDLQAHLAVDSVLDWKEMKLANFHFFSQKADHHLSAGEVAKLRDEPSFRLLGVSVLPKDSTQTVRHPMIFPEVHIKKWNRSRYATSGEWVFEKIKLLRPIFTLEKERFSYSFFKKGTDPSWPLILLDSLEIDNAQLNIGLGDSLRLDLPLFDLKVYKLNTKKRLMASSGLTDLYQTIHLQALEGGQFFAPEWQVRADVFSWKGGQYNDLEWLNLNIRSEKTALPQETEISRLSVNRLRLDQLLKKNELVLDNMVIGSTKMRLLQATKRKPAWTLGAPACIKLPFNAVRIGQLRMDEAYLNLQEHTPLTLGRIHLIAEGIRTDSIVEGEKLEKYYQYLDFGLRHMAYTLGKYDEYDLSQVLHFNSRDRQLLITDLDLTPKYTKTQFSAIIPHQEDLFDLEVDSVKIHGFRWSNLFRQPLRWPKAEIVGMKLDIFRDQNPVHPNDHQDLVQEQVKRIPFPFVLDTLKVSTDIHFSILPENTSLAGVISFNDLKGNLIHITNQDSLWDRPMLLDASGKIYDRVAFNASVEFDMADPMNSFLMSGKVGRMDIELMNNILLPTARIFIRKGKNKEITFDISANKDVAIGDMFFRYNKLKFRIVDKDDIHHTSLGNSLLTFWANRLVKSNNPSFLRKREGVIYFERNPNRAIFHYWSRALLSGIVSSVGVKNNRRQLKQLGYENLEALNYQELFGEKEEEEKEEQEE